MADLNYMRPCRISTENKDCRALFHGWAEFEKRSGDEAMKTVNAIVELADGRVECVSPGRVRFLDTLELFETYDWTEEG